MSRNLTEKSSAGDVVTGPVYLHSVVFAGADAAGNTLEVRDGTGTAVKLTMRALNGTTAVWTCGDSQGVLFSIAIHHTHSGTGATASYEYS